MNLQTPAYTPAGRVEALDLLRLIAALAVVLFHFGFRGNNLELTNISLPEYEVVLKYGYLGVQLFFVISGFVIAYSAEGRTPIAFGIARFARIYPTFVLCMTITFFVVLLFGAPRMDATVKQWFANLFIMSELLRQPTLDGSYWSIVYEVVFYGWVFILLSLGLFKRENYPFIIVTWLAISIVDRSFLHLGALRYGLLTDQSAFFCAGLALYAIYREGYNRTNVLLLALTAVMCLSQAFLMSAWNRANYHVDYNDTVIAIVCLAIIAMVALTIRLPRLPISSGLLLAIGGLTYPVYLLHQHIGYVLFNLFEGSVSPAGLVVAVTAAMLAASFLIWRFVETPLQRRTKAMLSSGTSYLVQKLSPA